MDLISYILSYLGRNRDNSLCALAKDWLTLSIANYRLDHERSIEKQFVPTRLVSISDIGKKAKIVTSRVCLLCIEPSFDEPYTTLSHKWGTVQSFRTTRGNFATHRRGIKFKELPKTFQDAIHVTRALGIRYIWIDALCVIQDDLDDWNNEAALMARVYGSALLNIAAHSAGDDQSGFLKKDFVDKRSNLRWRSIPEQFSINGFEPAIDKSALSRRSWVLQERLLSPRVLHFVDDYMFWEDNYSIRSQDGTHTDCAGIRSLWKKQGLMSDWYALMQMYTSLDITFASDRLPAIAGLVAELENRDDNEYCAGIWSGSIYQGLLWRPKDDFLLDSTSTAASSTPSWSWAYYDCPIQFPAEMHQLTPTVKFIRFNSRRASLNFNWQCRKAVLEMETALISLSGCLLLRSTLTHASTTRSGCAWKVHHSGVAKFTTYVGKIFMDRPHIELDPDSLVCAFIAKSKPRCDALFGCVFCREENITHEHHREFEFDYVVVLQGSYTVGRSLKRVGLGKFYMSSWSAKAERKIISIE